ncbi:MAG: hypothetical protein Q9M16_09625 [Mariprofundus sp.]|nr:hypothetical protein [Mariprofundus sp.]
MSQVIRISDDLYKRLAAHVSGFDTPSNVIERILNEFEGIDSYSNEENCSDTDYDIQQAEALEIVYVEGSEEGFKQQLLESKKAYIKIYFANNTTEIKEWNATRFSESSKVDGNLRSGYLRNWKKKGIYKVELAVDRGRIIQ